LTLFLIGGILGENLKNYSKLSKKGVKIAIFTPFSGDPYGNRTFEKKFRIAFTGGLLQFLLEIARFFYK